MKLLNVHIENFGKLHHFDYAFSNGLNTIYEENGFGKTTLATFIKVMLYGLNRTNTQNINTNDRKKYEPWNGGKYGGYLEFEYQDEQYRVTRFFGKSASKDTFSILNLTKHTNNTIFSENLGEELFGIDAESFMRSTYIPQNQNKGLFSTTSIQTKLSHLVEDTNDLNHYDLAIQTLKEKRTEIKKYKGSGGKISELEEELISIETKLTKIKDIEKLCIQYENEYHLEEQQLEMIQKELELTRKDLYRIPEQKIQKEKIKDIEEKIDELKEKSNELDTKYHHAYPTKEEVEQLKKAYSILEFNTYRLNELEHSQEKGSDLQEELPTDEEMQTCIKIIEDFKQKKAQVKESNHYTVLFFCLGLVVGAIMIYLYCASIAYACVCLFVAFVVFIYDVINRRKNDAQKTKRENIIAKEEKQLDAFFDYYLPNRTHDYRKDYDALQSKCDKSKQNKQKKEIYNEEIQKRYLQNQSMQERIDSFRNQYSLFDEKNVDEIITEDIKARNQYQLELESLSKQKEELLQSNKNIFERNIDAETINEKENELELSKTKIEENHSKLKYQIDACKEEMCHEQDLLDKQENLKQEKKEYENKCEILDKTMMYLEKAKDNLANRYLQKIEDQFITYSHDLMDEEIEKIILDPKLNLHIEDESEYRKLGYYSTGTIGYIDLCMRLALIDALFEKEQPFIILDDPFVDFDDHHLQKALDLMRKIAKNRQIIYFVCHSSRV